MRAGSRSPQLRTCTAEGIPREAKGRWVKGGHRRGPATHRRRSPSTTWRSAILITIKNSTKPNQALGACSRRYRQYAARTCCAAARAADRRRCGFDRRKQYRLGARDPSPAAFAGSKSGSEQSESPYGMRRAVARAAVTSSRGIGWQVSGGTHPIPSCVRMERMEGVVRSLHMLTFKTTFLGVGVPRGGDVGLHAVHLKFLERRGRASSRRPGLQQQLGESHLLAHSRHRVGPSDQVPSAATHLRPPFRTPLPARGRVNFIDIRRIVALQRVNDAVVGCLTDPLSPVVDDHYLDGVNMSAKPLVPICC